MRLPNHGDRTQKDHQNSLTSLLLLKGILNVWAGQRGILVIFPEGKGIVVQNSLQESRIPLLAAETFRIPFENYRELRGFWVSPALGPKAPSWGVLGVSVPWGTSLAGAGGPCFIRIEVGRTAQRVRVHPRRNTPRWREIVFEATITASPNWPANREGEVTPRAGPSLLHFGESAHPSPTRGPAAVRSRRRVLRRALREGRPAPSHGGLGHQARTSRYYAAICPVLTSPTCSGERVGRREPPPQTA